MSFPWEIFYSCFCFTYGFKNLSLNVPVYSFGDFVDRSLFTGFITLFALPNPLIHVLLEILIMGILMVMMEERKSWGIIILVLEAVLNSVGPAMP